MVNTILNGIVKFFRFIAVNIIFNFIVGVITFTINRFRTLHDAGISLIVLAALIQSVVIPQHVAAIIYFRTAIVAFYLFIVVGSSMINLFNVSNYNGKQSYGTLIIISIVSIVTVYVSVLYALAMIKEIGERPQLGFNDKITLSLGVMGATSFMFLLGNVFLYISKIFGKPIER